MKRAEIAKRMARRAKVSEAEAADRLDRVVVEILSKVRKGQQAGLPGLGRFSPGPDGAIAFEPEGERAQ